MTNVITSYLTVFVLTMSLIPGVYLLGCGVLYLVKTLVPVLGTHTGRQHLKAAAVCTMTHSNRWYVVSRSPVGFADWTDVWCCPVCGDRWCKTL